MARQSEFAEFVAELLEPFGGVSVRGMFGGFGLFRDGVMFGLIADVALYLKADDENGADFDAAGMGAFVYRRNGRDVALSYREAPSELFDDSDELVAWARRAHRAALRAQASGKGRG